jgi:hypothetical protein
LGYAFARAAHSARWPQEKKARPNTKSAKQCLEAPEVRSATLYFVWYNFVKIHKAHRMSPAMAAGLTDKLWSIEDIVALVEASDPKPG